MGNLLLHEASFAWENCQTDRSNSVQQLNVAIDSARRYGDEMFKTPNFSNLTLSWGNFADFIFATAYDSQNRETRFPWMKQNDHNTLIYLLATFQSSTPSKSSDYKELLEEFPNANNGWASLEANSAEPSVYSTNSWEAWHRSFVIKNAKIRHENYQYYTDFYKGDCLQTRLNQIQQLIDSGKTDRSFTRIDNAKILHEQIHMHFQNGWALNLDGTWKHKDPNKKFVISNTAKRELLDWGFLLPM